VALSSRERVHAKVTSEMTRAAARTPGHRRVGRYLICGEMASGGMASVHLGRLLGPVGFSKIVAIKRLHSQFADDPEFLAMFIDEARLASAISHPNVVSSLDVVAEQDELLLVMEYVPGETLAQLQRLARRQQAPASLGIIQRILSDTLDGLHAAHMASIGGRPLNIVHRDVSPQNIMVGANGVARVLDFGIAKAESKRQFTQPGRVKGKLAYLSPEQLLGQVVDARTDVFSAGVVLWESITGHRLFAAETTEATVERVLSVPIALPSTKNSAVSAELDRVVMKALERDPASRYDSAAEFADALRAVPGQAPHTDVSAWVRHTAAEVLARRLEALEELEAMDVADSGFFPVQSAPLDSSARAAKDRPLPTPRGDTEPTLTLARESTSPLAFDEPSPQQRRVAWRVGMGILVGSAVAIAIASSRPHPAQIAASSLNSPPSAQATKVLHDDSGALVALDANVQVPVVQLEQLEKAPRAVSQSPTPHRKPAVSVKAAAAFRAPAKARDCNPPYRIDASGVRRVRFECL
jgi:eukaryotic-like serine/threonine-protein kinase